MVSSYAYLLLFWISVLLQPLSCFSVQNITSSRPLLQNETLVSPTNIFELGFFNANGSDNMYIGIWYKNIPSSKIVWVGNRENPLSSADHLATLAIGSDMNMNLVDGQEKTEWSTNVSGLKNDSFAVLLDDGNFVLVDAESGNYTWESFGNPCDAILPRMKIGIDAKTGEKHYLVSWKGLDDPSSGEFTFGLTAEVPTQPVIWRGSNPYWRGGPWDKSKFIGIPSMNEVYTSVFSLEQDREQETAYFSVSIPDGKLLGSYFVLSSSGILELMFWDDGKREWIKDWAAPSNRCEIYATCGPFGFCNPLNSPICSCLTGFKPNSYDEWNGGNWTGGCVRKSELNCQKNEITSVRRKEDTFFQISQVKLPDLSEYMFDVYDLGGCRDRCQSNCSCLAYSFVGGIGCMFWTIDLIDIQQFSNNGKDLYIRIAAMESGAMSRTQKFVISFTTTSSIILLLAIASVVCCRRRREKHQGNLLSSPTPIFSMGEMDYKGGPPNVFDFRNILAATDNFSNTNKLGQGGFGTVYKGKFQEGIDVAVKRLSTSSGQGTEEFRNEIMLISKLQHRNLVKLLGYCIEGEEKILVYEFLSNKSLDNFLFDPNMKTKLSWEIRLSIIDGVARGLLYLHRDSCLRVIHRDLKASNILLDENMNPSISDFGLARMFRGTKDLINTQRVVGTLGYMAPEYAMGGIFSEKSDVYSFGVLLLEIVSGRKNTSFHAQDEHANLLKYAWKLWEESRELELIEETLLGSCTSSSLEVMKKCIQIGLLCVQDLATDRPNMSTVVLMLNGESDPARPKEPMFVFQNMPDHDVLKTIISTNTVGTNSSTSLLFEGR